LSNDVLSKKHRANNVT